MPSRELTYPPKVGIFEDDFPFPKVGYVSVPWRVNLDLPQLLGGGGWIQIIPDEGYSDAMEPQHLELPIPMAFGFRM